MKEGVSRVMPWFTLRIGLTGRILVLVILAVIRALVIQAWNGEPGVGSKFCFTAQFGVQPSRAYGTVTPLRRYDGKPALVVVGNALNREVLDDQLSAANIPVRHALSGSAALAAARAAALHGKPLRLAIIDHALPDMTGVELAHAINTASEGAELQIILLTSLDRVVEVGDGLLTPDKADTAIGIVGSA
jgi:CheY-like chemotaxis protein